MKKRHNLLILALTSLIPAISGAQSYPYADHDDQPLQPVRTERCLVEGNFSCQASETSYSVAGVSCTEDCLILSNLNTCRLNNRCQWDPNSGCFIKQVCVNVSDMETCRRWETRAICVR